MSLYSILSENAPLLFLRSNPIPSFQLFDKSEPGNAGSLFVTLP
ncbi:hypothetical protein CLOSTASPAR_05367 [[Clostridium] asparagiforme DSM 15981]|uniref:Uncharacterized protein n=1 Tax=[Clostridium] asparagiforme DSM 15981 TaxID=518636 RepID=C0D7X1_9FIRM|nr:hypothetical protein CLOSTASPAR_05367 [[Clostridium] asparagiforme DSM 15981]